MQKIWPLEAHLLVMMLYQGTRLACLEMIRSGTTAFNDMYFFMEDAARALTNPVSVPYFLWVHRSLQMMKNGERD